MNLTRPHAARKNEKMSQTDKVFGNVCSYFYIHNVFVLNVYLLKCDENTI